MESKVKFRHGPALRVSSTNVFELPCACAVHFLCKPKCFFMFDQQSVD